MEGRATRTREALVNNVVASKNTHDQVADTRFSSLDEVAAGGCERSKADAGDIGVTRQVSEIRKGDTVFRGGAYFRCGGAGEGSDCVLSARRRFRIKDYYVVGVARFWSILNPVYCYGVGDVAVRLCVGMRIVGVESIVYPDKCIAS